MNKFKVPSMNKELVSGSFLSNHEEKMNSVRLKKKVEKDSSVEVSKGSLRELISFIGIIKAQHFGVSGDYPSTSEKLYMYATFVEIQEILLKIINGVSTKMDSVTEIDIKRLESKIYSVELDNNFICGTTLVEANVYHCKSICERAERQSSKKIPVAAKYLRKVSEYLHSLAVYLLVSQGKEVLFLKS